MSPTRDGLRIVIELRRGEAGDVVLNNLYAQTQLQSVYGINCVALVDGQPRVLNLKQMLEALPAAPQGSGHPALPVSAAPRKTTRPPAGGAGGGAGQH